MADAIVTPRICDSSSLSGGDKFNRLTFLHYVEKFKGGARAGAFRCECGTEKIMRVHHVLSGRSRSCGCYHRQRASEATTTHGRSRGKDHSGTYAIWCNMKARCSNPKQKAYPNYGGRGIEVCERWLNFENFLSDMGDPAPGMSIERDDNDGNYEPGNCHWATRSEQNSNRRVNVFIELNGRRQTIAQWSKELDLCRGTIQDRMLRGETDPTKLLAPPRTPRVIEFGGKIQTIPQWSKELGISKTCIERRLLKGLPAEMILRR